VLSKSFEGQTNLEEKWYGTNYRVRRIPSETLEQWKNCVRPAKLKIDFPKRNPFIPSESGLQVKKERLAVDKFLKRTFESRMVPLTPPRVIRDDGPNGRWTVHFKQDDRFGQPKGYVIFQILSRDAYATPMRAALANFFEICASDRLGEYAYDAELAGLVYDLKVLPRGVRLTFGESTVSCY
jgi:insulysin